MFLQIRNKERKYTVRVDVLARTVRQGKRRHENSKRRKGIIISDMTIHTDN